jgi:hypothetical protein
MRAGETMCAEYKPLKPGTIVYPENEALRYVIAEQKKEIESLKALIKLWEIRYAEYRKALEQIEEECVRHDTTAWSIASDALENTK